MADEKKIPEEKKVTEEELDDVAGGKGKGIKGVSYTETVDISESVQNMI